jgi:hypothetical protein
MPSCFTHQTPPRVEGDDENVAAEEGLLTFSALKAVMLRLSMRLLCAAMRIPNAGSTI